MNEGQLRRLMLAFLDDPRDDPEYMAGYMRIRRRAARLQNRREVRDAVEELRRLLLT